MQESFRNGSGSSKLTLLAMFVAVLGLFLFTTPSAKAQTYSVTITGGSAGGCSAKGAAGTLVISGDTLEFTSTSDCYFGNIMQDGNGFDSGPSNCTNAATTPPPGLSCTTLSIANVGSNEYTFTDTSRDVDNAGACTSSTNCSSADVNENFTLTVHDANCATSGSAVCNLALGTVGGNTAVDVQFDDAELVTPEPASYLLFGSGLLGLGAIFRKKLGRVT